MIDNIYRDLLKFIMIKQEKVICTFPMGADFIGNVQIDIYRRLIGFVKDLMCFNLNSKCDNCCKNRQCRYYQMTGENFTNYPGILIKNDLFMKKHYIENEQIEFEFFFIGNNDIYKDYVQLFFEQLNQNMFGNFFYLNLIDIKTVNEKGKLMNNFLITTPIELLDFKLAYNRMSLYYNAKYNTHFSLLKNKTVISNEKLISWTPICLKTKKIRVNGYVYKIEMTEEIDQSLLAVGVGMFNFLGGGHIEAET